MTDTTPTLGAELFAEPTGLGAVVEDISGERWVRCDTTNLPWRNAANTWLWEEYNRISVIRVLSEGVA